MRVYITGGGESEHFKSLDQHYLKQIGKEASILVVPVAAEQDEYEYTLERIEATYEDYGHRGKVEMITDLGKVNADFLAQFDSIYIDGGNTFKLINEFKSNQFIEHLKAFVAQDKIIHGDSAAGIILGSHIQTAYLGEDGDENKANLQAFNGLNLFDNWAFHAHYEFDDDEQIQDLVYERGASILALAEPCGIFIENNNVQVFGHEDLYAFTMSGKHHYKVGSQFDLKEALEA